MQTKKYRFAAFAALATLLLIAGTAVGLGTDPILVGKNGVAPTLVFGKSDVRDALPDDWDHDNLKLGFQRLATLSVDRTLVVTSDGTDTLVYLPLSIRDAEEGDYMGIIEVTVAGTSVDSMRTVLRTPWDRDVTSATWTDAFSVSRSSKTASAPSRTVTCSSRARRCRRVAFSRWSSITSLRTTA